MVNNNDILLKSRWNSTFKMLTRLLELKEFIKENAVANKELNLSETQWAGIAELTKGPANITSQVLQKDEQLVLGDFYKAWIKCKLSIAEIKTTFSNSFLNMMQKREKNLFENNLFRAGLYLGPRFQVDL
jgi:hypothetical protein